MKKRIIFIAFFLLIAATSFSQYSDTTISVDKRAVPINGKSAYVTNSDSTIFGQDTLAEKKLTAMLTYFLNKSMKVTADSLKTYNVINSATEQDTLSATTISKTYALGFQYPRVKLSAKYDSTSVKNDTLRIYNIGALGDTSLVYVLDSADNRVGYIVCAGDKQFREWRLDILCPENLRIVYTDAVIYTTKWMIILKALKY